MKKLLITVFVCIMLISSIFTGCGGSGTTTTTATTSITTSTTKVVSTATTPTTGTSSTTAVTSTSTTTTTTATSTPVTTTSTIPVTTTTSTLTTTTETTTPEEFTLIAISFDDGQPMPAQCRYYGTNISPQLAWTGIPAGTVSLALLVEDPDGGNWSHWVIFNMGPDTIGLGEDVPKTTELENGVKQGTNGFGQIGWGGPSPPSGTHHYYFRLYALDTMLTVPAGATLTQVRNAMQGHILDTAELMGTFSAG